MVSATAKMFGAHFGRGDQVLKAWHTIEKAKRDKEEEEGENGDGSGKGNGSNKANLEDVETVCFGCLCNVLCSYTPAVVQGPGNHHEQQG